MFSDGFECLEDLVESRVAYEEKVGVIQGEAVVQVEVAEWDQGFVDS